MHKPHVHQWLPLLLALLLMSCATLLLVTQVSLHLDYALADRLTRQYARQLSPDPDIVVIDIDDYSLMKMKDFAGRWVWPRSVHAELLEAVLPLKPRAIVFDILFAEPDIYRPDADRYFNEVLSGSSNVYFSMLELNASAEDPGILLRDMPKEAGLLKGENAQSSARTHLLLPQAISPDNWRLGTINFSSDSDGIGRSYDVRRNIDGWYLPSLPAKVVADLNIALPKHDKILLQWRGRQAKDFTSHSYFNIYQAIQEDPAILSKQLTNKIIVIGATASGLFDLRATPISPHYPAVYMLATALDNLKNQRYMTLAPTYYQWVTGLAFIIMNSLIFWRAKKFNLQLILAGLASIVCSLLLIWLAYRLVAEQRLFYIATPILIGLTSYLVFSLVYGFREYLERQQAINMFGRFLDPNVVTKLVEQGKLDIKNTSQKVAITVLFSDIRGFTSLSEQRSATQVVELLNSYFNRQVEIIFAHRGTLDKFIGDCIMAFWGAPVANANQEIDAINAALAMEDHLQHFREKLPPELRQFDVGIGIHSGEAIVGMIGAERRIDYTAIGDTVNLASRIEGVTKNTARILVSEQTMLNCRDAFNFIYHGEFAVKGRAQAVKLYQPERKP